MHTKENTVKVRMDAPTLELLERASKQVLTWSSILDTPVKQPFLVLFLHFHTGLDFYNPDMNVNENCYKTY